MIKVSVIVPVYNIEKYLEKCIDSLLAQTLEEIEIIAVDDGSEDSSPEILKKYAAESEKVKYFVKQNEGAAEARNYGLIHATGKYVGYLDSDDFADPEMFEVMYNKAEKGSFDIVECNLHHTYENREDTEIVEKIYEREELLSHARGVVWNKIFRRDWLVGTGVKFPPGFIYEDLAFIANLVPYIKKYGYVDIAPVHYVQRINSVNNARSERTFHIFDILRNIITFYKERGFYEQYKMELEYFYTRILLCSSLARMCLIPDRKLRERGLMLTRKELMTAFPNWRKNSILKKEKGKNVLFMKMQILPVYKLCGIILPPFFRLKERQKYK